MEGLSIANELLPFGSPFIALFSLIPIYIALTNSRSHKEAFFLMALQALTVHLFSSYWLAFFHDFAVFTLGASAFGSALEAGLCGIFFYLPNNLKTPAKELEENGGRHSFSSIFRVFWFAACWVLWEFIKSVQFLGYPWGTIFMASYKWKLIGQIVSITGVWGISFIFAWFSAFAAEGIMLLGRIYRSTTPEKLISDYKQIGKATIWIFAIVLLHGIVQYTLPRFPSKYVNAVLVQHNKDTWEQDEEETIKQSMILTEQAVEKMKEDGITPDIIVWSEGVLERSFPNSASYYNRHPEEESLTSFISKINVPFLIGGRTTVNKTKRHYNNSAILFDKNGTYAGFYSKMHLVPFAEEIPLQDNEVVKHLMRSIVGFSNGWSKGKQFVLFKIPLSSKNPTATPLEYRPEKFAQIQLDEKGRSNAESNKYFTTNPDPNPDNYLAFTTPICFEDSFDDVCRVLYNSGSEIFLNITNDSWSKTAPAEYQHFIAASFRAIQYRTTLVRCCNSGYTVVVGPNGRIIQDIPVFTSEAMIATIPVYERTSTIFARYGDWFAHFILTLIGLYTIALTVIVNRGKSASSGKKQLVIRFEPVYNSVSEEPEIADLTAETPAVNELYEENTVENQINASVIIQEPAEEKPEIKEEKPVSKKKAATSKSPVKTGKAKAKADKEVKTAAAKKAGTSKSPAKTSKVKAKADKEVKPAAAKKAATSKSPAKTSKAKAKADKEVKTAAAKKTGTSKSTPKTTKAKAKADKEVKAKTTKKSK